MYHDVVHGGGKYANDPEVLRAHLEYVRRNHPVVLPGDPLTSGELSACLTFDDAHVGFFHFVYPMLREMGLRAMVAVSTNFILEDTAVPMEQRLGTSSRNGREGAHFQDTACFCTWKELREMQAGGVVEVACHSAGHVDLTRSGIDLEREIHGAGRKIAEHLETFPQTFVFPLGRVNPSVARVTKRFYPYCMRIGGALNRGWRNPGGLIYRLQGDGLQDERGPLRDLWKPRLRYYWNTLRLR
ncbi:Polysaccharide deacetylase [Desulfonatronum thiosulfatophilum]|uniref:Polysaccharide deacetylase n=2 Tax=Desulfonatronum thiosulfatophilum TaxID=617002 RepID=A0A1G6ATQ5_9BACT|nr:Polysaccharide deacetylase [Desulfonatronum thiosulfatophilum]